jgi:hypothetical protein
VGGGTRWVILAVIATAACRGKPRLPSTIDDSAFVVPGERSSVPSIRESNATSGHDATPPPSDAAPAIDAGYDRGDASIDAGSVVCTGVSAAGTHEPSALPLVWAPKELGVLVGPHSARPPGDLKLHGTDLGFSFEHDGKLVVMFGDTLRTPNDTCLEEPNDDTMATLPLEFDGTVPMPVFHTRPEAPDNFIPVQLMRGTESLRLGFAQAPLTGFSDGSHAFALFDRLELPRCADGTCNADQALSCSTRIGECQPLTSSLTPPLCDIETQLGCFAGQRCVAMIDPVCVDFTSSQFDGSVDGEVAAAAGIVEWGMQRAGEPEVFDDVLSFRTNKFMSATSRTIERLDDDKDCNDYRPGHHDLLVWGRPRYSSQGGREARLYLMAHTLPLTFDAGGQVQFSPRFFAGVDPATDEPMWSSRQDDAAPLAMDGAVDGDPHEPVHIVNHTAISWLSAPINKWVMLYGGGLSDVLLPPALSEENSAAGAVMMRFADHPWGPWSPPQPHLMPGSPSEVGDPYGPGGFLYNPDCRDAANASCALPDALLRDLVSFAPRCGTNQVLWDKGELYGVNIIDKYSKPNPKGGLDMIWTVSSWNPYAVVMLETTVDPR